MSRKLTHGSDVAFYAYNRRLHRIDARVVHKGRVFMISGRNLGEVKNTLFVLAGAAGTEVFTLVPARSV